MLPVYKKLDRCVLELFQQTQPVKKGRYAKKKNKNGFLECERIKSRDEEGFC